MRRRDWLQVVGCGLSFSLTAHGAPGVRGLSLAELCRASLGVCTAVPRLLGSRWVTVFGQRRIVSDWHVPVVHNLAGELPNQFELATLGGAVDAIQQWVPHEAKLVADQAHVLFVLPGPLNRLWVTGMLQGAYALQNNTPNGVVVLTAEQSDIAIDPHSACARLVGCSSVEVKQALSNVRT